MPEAVSASPDITIVLTGHREGVLCGPTIRCALDSIAHTERETGLTAEIIGVLDRADETTRTMFRTGLGDCARIVETDFGDPGQARNHGVELARGRCAAFLDADDLWSVNWLGEAWRFIEDRPDAVAHSACIVTFGRERNVWWHVDSEGDLFDPRYLIWGNYWDSMSFARVDLYRDHPFRAIDLSRGFGHEDWHWNCTTLTSGVAHKPVPETIHFKRRRAGSQMSAVARTDSVIWPDGTP